MPPGAHFEPSAVAAVRVAGRANALPARIPDSGTIRSSKIECGAARHRPTGRWRMSGLVPVAKGAKT